MARLNVSKRERISTQVAEETTTNFEGAVAFKLSAHSKLIEQVVGAFWNEDLFYTKGSETSKSIVAGVREVAKTDPRFPLQLAAYARNVLHLRTTPQVLLVEASRIEGCKPFVQAYTPKIVKRADELAEVVAYFTANYGKGGTVTHKNFPNALKRGLADAFVKFDEYQLAKYDSSKADVTLGQVAQLVHPALGKPLYNYLTKGEVSEELPKIAKLKEILARTSIEGLTSEEISQSGLTWENFISKFGSTKETWEFIIPQMGYMALLRNLRNFEQKDVDLAPVLARLADPEEVKRSKQLPYRFYSAYKEVTNQKVQRAIAQAFEASISNVRLEGSTAVMIDLSNSMNGVLSAKSKMTYKNVGSVLGAIVTKKSEESVIIGFGDTAAEVIVNPDDTMMTNIKAIESLNVGYSTNAWLAFDGLGTRKVDRIVLISDMQCYDSQHRSGYNAGYGWGYNGASPQAIHEKWAQYTKNINPNAKLYSLDVSAYGTKQFPSKHNNVITLNGWSDKIIDLMALNEKGDVMIGEVRKW